MSRLCTRLLPRTALFLATLLAADVAEGQRKVEMRYAFDRSGAIRIHNMVGSVRVTGTDVDSLIVTGSIGEGSKWYGGADDARRAAKFGVETGMDGKVAPTHLDVRVPAGTRIWIKASSADVTIAGISGGIDVFTVGGAVRIDAARQTPRELNVETMDGAIEIDGSPRWLRAKSATGSITLRGSADDLALSSVSGPIAVEGGKASVIRGRVETVTGDIRFAGAVDRGGAATFDSHSGRIELVLPPSGHADIEVTSIMGDVTNNLSSRKPIKGREGRGQELSFRTGGGGAHITVRSFKGPVVLTGKS